MSEYSILETLYLIPLSIDSLTCSLTIGIFSCVKAPDHIKAFRMLQIAIILCSLSLTITLSFLRPVIIPSFTIISASLINLSQTGFLIFGHIYFFLYIFHLVLHAYSFFLRCLAISSPKWKIRVRRIFSFFYTSVFLLVITLIFYIDYLVIAYQIHESNRIESSIDFSVLINDSNFPLTVALGGLLLVFGMSWVIVIVTLLYKLPHLGSPLGIKIQTMHQQLLRVSLVQMIFLVTICCLPLLIIALSTFVQDKETKQILSNALMITTLHSSGNCLIVLFVTKYYRDLFIKLYQVQNARRKVSTLWYDFRQGKSAAESHRTIIEFLGEESISERQCQRWFQRFKDGNESFQDEERSGRPQEISDENLLDAIELNPTITTCELADTFGMNQKTIDNHLYQLGKTNHCGIWVPHELTQGNN